MKTSRLVKLIIVLTITVQLIGCKPQPDSLPTNINFENKISGNNEELEKNRELWQNSQIANYNFVISKMDMGDYGWIPSLIKVRDNQVVSKKPLEKSEAMSKIDEYNDFDTVEKTFNQIQEAYSKGYSVKVRYNKDFGYPEETVINHMKSTDSAFSIKISKFEVIKDN